MEKRDYYEVLGVQRNATEAELKSAYRRLAMKLHPDRNPGDDAAEARFKEAKEAYEVLKDPRKRAAYDQFGHAGVDGGGAGGFDPGQAFSDIFGDMFGDIFGQGRRSRSRVFRGADLRYDLDLSLEQAVMGDAVEITVPARRECTDCDGSGCEPGTSRTGCSMCGGQGAVRMQQGLFAIEQACPQCKGQGTTIESPCRACHGEGRIRDTRSLSVKVPPGVDTGDRIRLGGEGEAGRNGGPAGDLYVEIRVRPHPLFERDGAHLHTEIPISFATAVLGGTVEVPTLTGQAELRIPDGTQSGKVFRIRGKGVRPVRGGATGDLHAHVAVETPVKLTREQKDLLRTFDESLTESPKRHRPREHGWLDGVKSFFEKLSQ
mgnify:CR=1 FL=1|jgi:molecular chaperone DnaJ